VLSYKYLKQSLSIYEEQKIYKHKTKECDTGTFNNNGKLFVGLICIYTGVLGNFRRVGEVGVFSCSDSARK
jgi:hypothetical protein